MCWSRSHGPDLMKWGLMHRLPRFRRDEAGAGTVFSLGLLFLAALLGGSTYKLDALMGEVGLDLDSKISYDEVSVDWCSLWSVLRLEDGVSS